MSALVACIAALIATYWAGRKSLGAGIISLLAWGYFYGIVRANMATVFSHFIFDAAMLGLYLAQKDKLFGGRDTARTGTLQAWMKVLFIWPLLLLLLPFQPMLVSLVGLRGFIFFLPLLMLGSQLEESDLRKLSSALTILNLTALGFAVAEYFKGVPMFYPHNSVTTIIYMSGDVEGGFLRIPGIFANAHAYGGTMVNSMPLLVGGWTQARSKKEGVFAVIGVAAALLGILLSATRLNFILGSGLILFTMWRGKLKKSHRVILVVVVLIMAGVALTNERFQRFKSLGDTDMVSERVNGSINRGFFEIFFEYPMGNGLGGGGTSMPYFLQSEVRNPVAMENEYARILFEQGIIGLVLWISFAFWYVGRGKNVFSPGPWGTPRRLVWCVNMFWLLTATIGLGLLTSIPSTAFVILGMGWTGTAMAPTSSRRTRAAVPQRQFAYAPPR